MRKPISTPVALALAALAHDDSRRERRGGGSRRAGALPRHAGRRRRHRRRARPGVRDPHDLALHVVVLRRPARDRAPRLGLHRLHQHRRPGEARRVQRRHRPAPAADAVPRARGRRPQQPQPDLLPPQALRVRLRARGLRLPAPPQQPDAVPGVQARLGRGARLARNADDPARARLRPRLHVPEPRGVGQADVPVHARTVLVPVLHLDHRREDLGGTADPRARPARGGPERAPVCEVRHGAGRLDPDDVLRRPSRLLPEQPLLHAVQGRQVPAGRMDR